MSKFIGENWYGKKTKIIHSYTDHDEPEADGVQRQKYMEYIIENHLGDLAIVIDADEVFADNAEETINMVIKAFTNNPELDFYSPLMEHFIDNFRWVDASKDKHVCPTRIFRINEGLHYPLMKHCTLEHKNKPLTEALFDNIPILYYHLGYLKGKDKIIEKYNRNVKGSKMHDTKYLDDWKMRHLFGLYPVRTFIGEYPKVIREVFKFDKA